MADKGHKSTGDARRRWTPDYVALWVIAVLSLLLNLVTFRELALARNAARQAIIDAIATIDQFEQSTITTNVRIDDTVVIDTDLPVDESFPVEIKDSFPIDTVLAVPVDAGLLGTLHLNVPIKTTIPVDVKPTVTINQTFHVKAPLALKLDVPIQVQVATTGLAPALEGLRARLQALADQLDSGLLPGPAASTPVVK